MCAPELVEESAHSIRCAVLHSAQRATHLIDHLYIDGICGLSLVIRTRTGARVRAATY